MKKANASHVLFWPVRFLYGCLVVIALPGILFWLMVRDR